MKLKRIYTLYDNLTQEYSPIFIASNDLHAYKLMQKTFERSDRTMDDCDLFDVGCWDDEDGLIISKEKKIVDLDKLETKEDDKDVSK